MKIGVFYATMSGNTEAIADCIAECLVKSGFTPVLKEIPDINHVEELKEYDLIFLGMYTWGDGDFPDECLDFVEEMGETQWDNTFALFGSGDTSYDDFCGALDRLKPVLTSKGATIATNLLRIEMAPDKEEEEEIATFVKEALDAASIRGNEIQSAKTV
ncbi:MAG: flavodoxin domain-containing protein [Bacillus sp. (in: firmicutes)]